MTNICRLPRTEVHEDFVLEQCAIFVRGVRTNVGITDEELAKRCAMRVEDIHAIEYGAYKGLDVLTLVRIIHECGFRLRLGGEANNGTGKLHQVYLVAHRDSVSS